MWLQYNFDQDNFIDQQSLDQKQQQQILTWGDIDNTIIDPDSGGGGKCQNYVV